MNPDLVAAMDQEVSAALDMLAKYVDEFRRFAQCEDTLVTLASLVHELGQGARESPDHVVELAAIAVYRLAEGRQ